MVPEAQKRASMKYQKEKMVARTIYGPSPRMQGARNRHPSFKRACVYNEIRKSPGGAGLATLGLFRSSIIHPSVMISTRSTL